MLHRAIALPLLFLLASCGSVRLPTMPEIESITRPHRMEIQQGNFVSQEMVAQLKIGQTKDQVRFILGSPLIIDSFHTDRWDYVFWRTRANSKELEQRKLVVFFEDNLLKRVDGDVIPAATADPGGIKTPDAPPKAAAVPAAPPAAKTAPPQPAVSRSPTSAVPPAAAAPAPPGQQDVKSAAPPGDAKSGDGKQAAKQDKANEPPDMMPEPPKRDTRTFWEKLKEKMTF